MNKFNKENVQTFNVEVIKNVLASGIDGENMGHAIENIFEKSNEDTKMIIAEMSHDFAVAHGYSAPSEIEAFYAEMHTSQDQSWSEYFWSFLGY